MRVLVTGATGAIGSSLCDTLLARGDEVIGLSRNPEKARGSSPAVQWHSWNPTGERPDPAAFDGVDAVVNLTGEPIDQRWTDSAKEKIMESRRTSTRNLVETLAGLENKPGTLISGSAIGYYGDRGDVIVDESSGAGDDFAAQVVAEWETAAEGVKDAGIRLVIVRTGLVLNPEAGLLKRLLPPFKLGVGGPLAGGKQYMSWVHLADEIGVLVWALENRDVEGIVNACAPNPVTNKEFSKALGKAVHRPAILPTPGFAVNAILGSEAAEHTAKSSTRVVPKRTQELGYSFRYADIGPALENLL